MKNFIIFYADDDEDDLFLFEEAVNSLEEKRDVIKLNLHKNGERLIDAIIENKDSDSVVFLDLNMPLKSGFDFLKEIRSNDAIKNTPIIIYSTSSSSDVISKSESLGANFYAVKPYTFDDLKKIIFGVVTLDWRNNENSKKNFIFNKLIAS